MAGEILTDTSFSAMVEAKTLAMRANPVAFKRDRFELQYFDQRWLSDTPFEPGSRFADQSGCPRIFVVCTLRDRMEDKLRTLPF